MTVSGLTRSNADRQPFHKSESQNPQDSVSEAETEFMTAVRTLQDQELMAESKNLCLQNSTSSETISEREN